MGRPKGSHNTNPTGGLANLTPEHREFLVTAVVNFQNKAKAARTLFERYPECEGLVQLSTVKQWLSSDAGCAEIDKARGVARETTKDIPLVDATDRVRALADLAQRLLERARETLDEEKPSLPLVRECRETMKALGEEARSVFGTDANAAGDIFSRVLAGVAAVASDLPPELAKRLGVGYLPDGKAN